jgi:hypothetical protein
MRRSQQQGSCRVPRGLISSQIVRSRTELSALRIRSVGGHLLVLRARLYLITSSTCIMIIIIEAIQMANPRGPEPTTRGLCAPSVTLHLRDAGKLAICAGHAYGPHTHERERKARTVLHGPHGLEWPHCTVFSLPLLLVCPSSPLSAPLGVCAWIRYSLHSNGFSSSDTH